MPRAGVRQSLLRAKLAAGSFISRWKPALISAHRGTAAAPAPSNHKAASRRRLSGVVAAVGGSAFVLFPVFYFFSTSGLLSGAAEGGASPGRSAAGATPFSSRVTLRFSLLCRASCSASRRAYRVCSRSRALLMRSTFSSTSLGSGPCAATYRTGGVRTLAGAAPNTRLPLPPGPAARPSSGSAAPFPLA